MSDPVTIGIGMMIAGKVVENQEWFGEDFGKALMVGGAVVAMNPGGVFSAAPVATKAGELSLASAMEPVSSDVAIGLAETGGETALTLGEQGMGAGLDSSVTGVSEMVPSLDPGLLESVSAPVKPTVDPSFLDSKWAAPSMMVGGQAVSGMMAAKSQEEIEKAKIAEEERLRKLRTSWGRTAGGRHVPLNVGDRLQAMSNRFQNNQNTGGLLT